MCGIYLYARNQFLNANHKEVCESNIGDKKDDDSIDEKSRTQPRVSQSNRGPSANNHITIQDRSFMPLEFTGSNGLVNRTTTVDMHFDRLQIIGDSKGLQPFQLENIYLMANAEIYNYLELSAKYNIPLDKIKSDCGIILHLYKLLGIDTMIEQLDGEFAFVIYDNGIIHMARDRCGIKPLYYYYYLDEFACASTVKALHMSPYQLPPGSMLSYNMHQPYIKHINNIPMRHYAINIQTYNIFKYLPINGGTYDSLRCCGVANNAVSGDATNNDAADVVANIRKTRKDNTDRDIYDSLVAAVQKRITMHNGEVEVGFFLSGGLDSSIILALAMEI
jgi:asparagine synthase (glutamine-hydrolysing)